MCIRDRDSNRANQAVEGSGSRAQRAAGHEEDVLGPRQEVVGDDAQRLVGNLVKRQNAGAHDAHERKQNGNGESGDGAGQRNVALRVLSLIHISMA